jgi:hypothetical protein
MRKDYDTLVQRVYSVERASDARLGEVIATVKKLTTRVDELEKSIPVRFEVIL